MKKKLILKSGRFFSRTFTISKTFIITKENVEKIDGVPIRTKITMRYPFKDILITIGIEKEDIDNAFFMQNYFKYQESEFSSFKEWIEQWKYKDKHFYKKLKMNFPYQRGYIFGSIDINQKKAHLESLFVKKKYRRRGYATILLERMLSEIDKECSSAYGKVNANEKPDNFTWGETKDYENIPMTIKEFNKRQRRLSKFYERFGFKIHKKDKDYKGNLIIIIKRKKQC